MRTDEYKRRAEEAEAAAREAKSELDRDEFLRIAQSWRDLARQAERDLKRGV